MKLEKTSIPDVLLIEPTVFSDERGSFMESFNETTFHQRLRDLGCAVPRAFVQDNHSCSNKGVLRGLHFQCSPRAQGKLVRVVKGAAWDVAVDLRIGSPTYGKWVGRELSAANNKMMWIPEGFAHGFVALEDDTHFLYKTTDVYSKAEEASLAWNDPDLAIAWPDVGKLTISAKDLEAPSFAEFKGLTVPERESTIKLLDFREIGDKRGSLVSLESRKNVPFDIKRVYYIYDTLSGVVRGLHAHRDLQQLLVCVSGSCKVTLDNGYSREQVILDSASTGLLIRNLIWREMYDFSEGCVLMVLASGYYDESDYIRNYDDFLNEVRNGKE